MGDVLASLAVILASVFVLAVVTDRCFIPSLDEISKRLKLSDEVAGASADGDWLFRARAGDCADGTLH